MTKLNTFQLSRQADEIGPTKKINGFDGVRGIAAISVVLTHLGFWEFLKNQNKLARKLEPLFNGTMGVQAFFILSGFLITLLLAREIQETNTISIKKFMVRRSLRILPLYVLFCLLATILTLHFENVASWSSLYYAYFYVYNFVPIKDYFPLLGHTWSLAVEEHFYIIWPAIFSLMFMRRKNILTVGLIVFISLSIFIHFVLMDHGLGDTYFIARWSFTAGYSIALGCLAALLMQGKSTADFCVEILRHRLAGPLGILLYVNSLYLSSGSWFIQNIVSGYIRSIAILIFIMWIYCNQRSSIVACLESRPLKYIGTISYGIYMWQGFLLGTGPARLRDQYWPPSPYIGLAILVVVAPLSYHYFETAFLKLKRNYASSPTRSIALLNK